MTTQLTLDIGQPRARRTDPPTSRAAAADAKKNAGQGRFTVMLLLTQHPAGLTDFELADLSGWQQTSIGKRRGELRDAGKIVDSGTRRPSPSGSAAIVWKLAPNNGQP